MEMLTAEPPTSEFKKQLVLESWQKGIRERRIERVFAADTNKGKRVNPKGDVTITVLTDKEQRNLTGWDPENPFPLPLDITKNAGDYSRVMGVISPRNPKTAGGIGLSYLDMPTLTGLLKTSELFALAPSKDGLISYEVKEGSNGFFGGARLHIDPAHGYCVRRIVFKGGIVMEVEEFLAVDDGVWLPKKIRNTSAERIVVTQALSCAVNSPIAESDLDFPFPEGCVVHDPLKKLTYLWGKDGPAKSFADTKELDSYQGERLQQQQLGGEGPPTSWRSYLMWGNLALVAIFALLLYARKKLAKKT